MRAIELIPCLVVFLFAIQLIASDGIDPNAEVLNVVYGNNTIGLREPNGTVCLLLSFEQLDVEVRGGPKNLTYLKETYNGTSDIDWYEDTSSCLLPNSNKTNIKQRLSLNVSGNHLNFYFKLLMPDNTYNMSLLTFKAENREQFNGTKILGVKAKMMPDLKINPLSKNLDQSFECIYRYALKFNFTGTNDTFVNVKITGLKFSAFRKSNSAEFQAKNKISCPAPKQSSKPGNDIVPIAVGSVLTGCLVVSLVGYLIMKARRS